MDFYVIYSYDTPLDVSVRRFQPPKLHKWQLTEQSDGKDGSEVFYEEGGKHRKYVALLSFKDFKEFVDDQCLVMDTVETMGSLTEFGLLPAHSFNGYNYEVYQNAYVTPLPHSEIPEAQQDIIWGRIKQSMLKMFE